MAMRCNISRLNSCKVDLLRSHGFVRPHYGRYASAAFPNPIIQNFLFTLDKETFFRTNLNKFEWLDSEKQNSVFLLERKVADFIPIMERFCR